MSKSKVEFKGILKRFHNTPVKAVVIRMENNLDYAATIHEGRKPGSAMPPIEPLKVWAKRKLGDENLAFAVAKMIAKWGFAAYAHGGEQSSKFLIRALKENTQENLRLFKQALSNGDDVTTAAKRVGERITNQAGDILDANWKYTGDLANATRPVVKLER